MTNKKNENIYIIIGEDTELIKQQVNKLEFDITNKQDYDVISFFSEETDTQKIIDNCNSFSVFSPKTLIKVYDFHNANIDLLSEYSKNPNLNTILILISFKNLKDLSKSKSMKLLQSNSKIIDIKPLYENQIIDKIHHNLRKLNLKYSNNVVDYIAQQVGKVDSGINKFFKALEETDIKGKITIEDVKELEMVSSEKNLFSFLDYFFDNNIISAINSYKSLISEGTPLLVLNRTIYNKTVQYINYLSMLEEGKSQQEIMNQMNIKNKWLFNKISSEAKKNNNEKKLRYILIKCYEIDKAIKSESIDMVNARFELFLTELKKDMLIF
jgi:DNA polymerase III delta subunit